jgi:hypothetical protein
MPFLRTLSGTDRSSEGPDMIRTKWMGVAVVAFGLVGTGDATADQCTSQTATRDQWEAAQKLVRNAPSVLLFCRPCGDRTPLPWSGAFSKQDLAYLYVQVGADRFGNVARMVGCNATDVSVLIDAAGRPR